MKFLITCHARLRAAERPEGWLGQDGPPLEVESPEGAAQKPPVAIFDQNYDDVDEHAELILVWQCE